MLPEENRLRKKKDHNRVYKKGSRFTTPLFVLLVLARDNQEHPSRFSFVVSKKVDKRAVVRNRVRRVLRESVRILLPEILHGFDCILIARNELVGLGVNEALPVIKSIFMKSGVLFVDEKSTSFVD